MLKLNLPKPSIDLCLALDQEISSTLPNYVPGYHYLKPKLADGIYLLGKINEIGTQEYQNLFDENIHVMCMILRPDPWKNSSTEYNRSCYRPHYDYKRTLALNYILDCGGETVTTTFYNKVSGDDPQVLDYDQVEPIRSYHLDKNIWYCLEASRYHSVENIDHDRIMLSICFTDLDLTKFMVKYNHFIDCKI